ncbi:MAG: MBL fold metallo-hydrolase [Candidatus Berkiella sp.]
MLTRFRNLTQDLENQRKMTFRGKTQLLSKVLETLTEEKSYLSPAPNAKGQYVTHPDTLDMSIDQNIAWENLYKTLKNIYTNLHTTPVISILNSIINYCPHFFTQWAKEKKKNLEKQKLKYQYYSENEDLDTEKLFKSGDKHKIENRVDDDFKVHNLAHSSLLIQTEGLNIETDPIHGDTHPFNWRLLNFIAVLGGYGAKSKHIDTNILPPVDVVLISHNHPDHMDWPSLIELKKKNQQVKIFCPMGDKAVLEEYGFTNVTEFEWHDEITVTSNTGKEVSFISLPANHRSGRDLADHHKSLVTSWLISPKDRNEIYFYAGDTARLDDDRITSLAVNIYKLYTEKNKANKKIGLPRIILGTPGGPNYTRNFMEPTHQSAVDSVLFQFRLALALEEVSNKDNPRQPIAASKWSEESIATMFMHHNRFELGPDRFNENAFILNRMKLYLKMTEKELDQHLEKQLKKDPNWSLEHRRKDFIIDGVKELKKDLARKIWRDKKPAQRKQNVIDFINRRTHLPLMMEKVSASDAFRFQKGKESTIKADSKKGLKKKKPRA